MIKNKLIITLSVLILLVINIGITTNTNAFDDVPQNSWYYNYVTKLVKDDVIDSGQKFRPNDYLNRAEFTKMAISTISGPFNDKKSSNPLFIDVSKDSWYYDYVEKAALLGIVSGYKDVKSGHMGKFGPEDKVTRAAATKILVNTFSIPYALTPNSPFIDVEKTAWYHEYITTAYNQSIIDGYPGTKKFGPGDFITRAQAAKLFTLAQNPQLRSSSPLSSSSSSSGSASSSSSSGSGSSTILTSSKLSNVWANDGGNKIIQNKLSGGSVNSVWNGEKIKLFGAKNEVVNFNLILEASDKNATGISIKFDQLKGPDGSIISSKKVDKNGVFNWVGRNIELFYVRYLEIKGLSTDMFYDNYDERHIPNGLQRSWTGEGSGTGTWNDRPNHNKFYPDIAVPLELMPKFDILANKNQSIWADVYIPKNANAGIYTGNVVISENGLKTRKIPVELDVKNFTLPDIPSAKTMLAYTSENINDRYLSKKYPDPGTKTYNESMELIDKHFQMAHRHKISLIDGDGVDLSSMNKTWEDRLSGNLFTSAKGYDGIGINTSNNIFSVGTYGSWDWAATKSAMHKNTDSWVNWFDSKNFNGLEYFLYLIDEDDNYSQTEKWAKWISSNPGVGKKMMSFATLDLPKATSKTPSLNIPAGWPRAGITNTWQTATDSLSNNSNKKSYLYNGGRPGTGTFAIEDDGVALRTLAWTQYKKKIDRWFYWESTYYNNYQGNTGQTDVFKKAQTFGNFSRTDKVLGQTGDNYLNGDGVLFYPGTDKRFTSSNYGLSGPIASLRLKHWRRGIQDVDYLTMAAKINPTKVNEIVSRIIPKVVWELGATDPSDPTWVNADISWSIDPDKWEATRKELADIIESNNQ